MAATSAYTWQRSLESRTNAETERLSSRNRQSPPYREAARRRAFRGRVCSFRASHGTSRSRTYTRFRAYHRRAPRGDEAATRVRIFDSCRGSCEIDREKQKNSRTLLPSHGETTHDVDPARICPAGPSILVAPFFRVIFYEFNSQDRRQLASIAPRLFLSLATKRHAQVSSDASG